MIVVNALNDALALLNRLASPAGRLSRFGYTQEAYNQRMIEGTASYDYANEQNIPIQDNIETAPVVVDKGIQTQGASIAREFQNHFTGRTSFNLNMVVDLLIGVLNFLDVFFRRNGNMYDSTRTYYLGDVVWVLGEGLVVQWYQCAISATTNNRPMPYTNSSAWHVVGEGTSQAWPMASSNLNTYTRTRMYVMEDGSRTFQNGPPIPYQDSGKFTLTVRSNTETLTSAVPAWIATQELQYIDSGIEYTRTLQRIDNVWYVIQDWYISKNPVGFGAIAVPNMWAFRVESDGHLRLYYGGSNTPTVFIDRDPNSPTYGHLLWDYDGM